MPPAPISRSTVYRPAREALSCVNVVIATGVRVTSAGRRRKGVARRIYEWSMITLGELARSVPAALARPSLRLPESAAQRPDPCGGDLFVLHQPTHQLENNHGRHHTETQPVLVVRRSGRRGRSFLCRHL